MSQEFGDDFISITDEDGKEYELEVLAELEYEGSRYLALVPAGTDEAEELEVSILKSVEENGEDILVTIDDDEELENVYQALMDLTAKLDAATARRDDLYARWENASEELAAGEEEV